MAPFFSGISLCVSLCILLKLVYWLRLPGIWKEYFQVWILVWKLLLMLLCSIITTLTVEKEKSLFLVFGQNEVSCFLFSLMFSSAFNLQWLETILSAAFRKKSGEDKRLSSTLGLPNSQSLVCFALCTGAFSDPVVTIYFLPFFLC